MKITFPEKSLPFEKAILEISDIIVNAAKDKIAFVILFGSFARGIIGEQYTMKEPPTNKMPYA